MSSEPEFRFVATRTPTLGDYETRHEAIGKLAKYGDWERGSVVPITGNCLVRPQEPRHLGNECYGDRNRLATKHGVTRINRETIVRNWNGAEQEVIESHWVIECPICYKTHKSEEATEDARPEIIDEVLDCCGTEWFPPSDWVEDCNICGDDHRGEFNCQPLSWRDPFPDIDQDFACARCGWDGHGEDVNGPNGECPNCDSTALEVLSG